METKKKLNHLSIKPEPDFKYTESQGELLLGVCLNIDGNSPLKCNEDDFNLYELFQSRHKKGVFYIFTCSCGIPECAGYKGIEVTHSGSHTRWHDKTLNRDYVFEQTELDQNISNAFQDLKKWVFYANSNNLTIKVYPDLIDINELMNSFESKLK